MSNKEKRYIGADPSKVDLSEPVGGELSVPEARAEKIKRLNVDELEFYNNIPSGIHQMPRNQNLIQLIEKLAELGFVTISEVKITRSKYYQKNT